MCFRCASSSKEETTDFVKTVLNWFLNLVLWSGGWVCVNLIHWITLSKPIAIYTMIYTILFYSSFIKKQKKKNNLQNLSLFFFSKRDLWRDFFKNKINLKQKKKNYKKKNELNSTYEHHSKLDWLELFSELLPTNLLALLYRKLSSSLFWLLELLLLLLKLWFRLFVFLTSNLSIIIVTPQSLCTLFWSSTSLAVLLVM